MFNKQVYSSHPNKPATYISLEPHTAMGHITRLPVLDILRELRKGYHQRQDKSDAECPNATKYAALDWQHIHDH